MTEDVNTEAQATLGRLADLKIRLDAAREEWNAAEAGTIESRQAEDRYGVIKTDFTNLCAEIDWELLRLSIAEDGQIRRTLINTEDAVIREARKLLSKLAENRDVAQEYGALTDALTLHDGMKTSDPGLHRIKQIEMKNLITRLMTTQNISPTEVVMLSELLQTWGVARQVRN